MLLRPAAEGGPSEQLVIVPIQTEPLHVRYQVSCDKLHRTTTLSS